MRYERNASGRRRPTTPHTADGSDLKKGESSGVVNMKGSGLRDVTSPDGQSAPEDHPFCRRAASARHGEADWLESRNHVT